MLISDGAARPVEHLIGVARRALEADAALSIQIREKQLDTSKLLERVTAVREALERAARPVPLLVNGRADVALAAGADGVHLPSRGAPVGRIRRALGERLAVGVSTHAVDEVREAGRQGADYILFGPVYPTPSKAGMGKPQGIERLAQAVRAAAPTPVLAVGGVTPARAAACREAGAWGVAVIRALLEATDPARALDGLAGGGGG
jgi:thiamine-phosphate pyrophosphorylase